MYVRALGSSLLRPAVVALIVGSAVVPLAAAPTTAAPATTAPSAEVFATGEVVAEVVSLSDAEQRYALYLPRDYDTARRWPAIFVLDPRGRGPQALELFRRAAEDHGWIILSSYGTRSDTEDDPNTPAIRALLDDAQRRFAVDTRRLYLAGMSGTAKVSWPFGRMLEGNIAGVIGTGGALPPGASVGQAVPFAFYGIAGTTDFNYREMRELDQALAEIGAERRFATFDGAHGWGPAEACAAAVAWMELAAIRAGLTPARADLIDRRLAVDRAAAESAREGSDPLLAWERFDQIVRDFEGLRDTSFAAAARDAIADAAARARAAERKLLRAERAYRDRIQLWLNHLAKAGSMPVKRCLAELQAPALQKVAASAPSREALSAARRLETAYVQAAYYLPQAFRARDRLDRVALMLEIATALKPDKPRPHWQLAQVQVERGDKDAAFAALDAAAARGPVDIERLVSDPRWTPLHKDPRWRSLLERLGSNGSTATMAEPAAGG